MPDGCASAAKASDGTRSRRRLLQSAQNSQLGQACEKDCIASVKSGNGLPIK